MKRLVILVLGMTVAISQGAPTEDTTNVVAILRQSADGPNPDGSYNWSYETENGSKAEESGSLREVGSGTEAIQARGTFSYTAPDGAVIELEYVADENGFQPQGAHLPVAPVIPEGIQRALDWIATHPEENDTDALRNNNQPKNQEEQEEK
ncbi:PREDICTED: endocuticle structural glycoprotein ABD-4-like [Ceratosolen solmsi marchali]|uniref:Endocuticle structural glycoprotein ABD-4-like n=1 Tax=Ceratosolen solmsi marchali TaxID=326594 RepID=A0AAJ7DYX6_9HYME|nr:PREDICTED: endocuticle structural glycoprotein ABD-4-like [Ceratosolen solmsi marchali]